MAGLPMIQKDNSDHLVAMQTIAQKVKMWVYSLKMQMIQSSSVEKIKRTGYFAGEHTQTSV